LGKNYRGGTGAEGCASGRPKDIVTGEKETKMCPAARQRCAVWGLVQSGVWCVFWRRSSQPRLRPSWAAKACSGVRVAANHPPAHSPVRLRCDTAPPLRLRCETATQQGSEKENMLQEEQASPSTGVSAPPQGFHCGLDIFRPVV
jgi:hypothetical protein